MLRILQSFLRIGLSSIGLVSKWIVFTLRDHGISYVACLFTIALIDEEHIVDLPSSTSMLSLNAPSMHYFYTGSGFDSKSIIIVLQNTPLL